MDKKTNYSKIKLQKGRVYTPPEPIHLSNLIDKVAKKLQLDNNSEDYSIIRFWEEFLKDQGSEGLAKYSFAHRITKDRKLVIGVRSAVIANELQFIKADLERSFLVQCSTRFKNPVKALVFELRT